MDGGATTSTILRGRTPTSVAGPNGGSTAIHVTALDGILHANSLFTFAAFVGLTWNPSSSGGKDKCSTGVRTVEHLVTCHVVAFACFLFSSIIALCLKQAVTCRCAAPRSAASTARINRAVLRAGIVASAAGSTFAVGFLMVALVNLVQVRLGRIGCHGGEGGVAAVAAVVVLLTLVPSAMLIYVGIVLYAFTR
ncbi:uncharacterized protein LOC109718907 [Ananas comosus]|uniref:Uncharacterized protein LOC109705071 n=1 Tax=Ananas comosus TaxID=4615 RepID=A0A6P5EDB5_ANACO|nr:uncharacterized protein LOC109705071 [Ananas comosus]XP_020100971.1 uncharacterized protein LOC109718907 [Ananas comosus]